MLFVSSIVAYQPAPPLALYGVSKTALLGLVKALAEELGPRNVRVNGIAPGIVPTKFSAALVQSEKLRTQQVRRRCLCTVFHSSCQQVQCRCGFVSTKVETRGVFAAVLHWRTLLCKNGALLGKRQLVE